MKMEKNYKDENVMMCDCCGHLFVTSPSQRLGIISNKYICKVCEKIDHMRDETHKNYQQGRL